MRMRDCFACLFSVCVHARVRVPIVLNNYLNCSYSCVNSFLSVNWCARVRVCACARVRVCACARVRVRACSRVYVCACECACVHACVRVPIVLKNYLNNSYSCCVNSFLSVNWCDGRIYYLKHEQSL